MSYGAKRPPASAAKTVQAYVSNLRRALGDGVLVTRGHGYMLQTGRGQVDVDRFEVLVDAGRTALGEGDARGASDRLREALTLWRGPPLADFAYEPFAQAEAARLEEERLAALEDRIDADLALGRHAALVGELEALVLEHPLRERLQGQLMLALYRSSRQADALERYQQARRKLTDELGIEPGQELQELERAILNQDPELGRPSRRLPRPPARRRGALLLALGGLIVAGAAVAAVLSLGGGTSSGPVLAAVDRRGDDRPADRHRPGKRFGRGRPGATGHGREGALGRRRHVPNAAADRPRLAGNGGCCQRVPECAGDGRGLVVDG